MSTLCRLEGCTFDDTGMCALNHPPASCPNREALSGSEQAFPADDPRENISESIGAPVLTEPASMKSLGNRRTLGPDDIQSLMNKRYVNVVGILGDPESGKTACLASVYLMISHAKLKGWSFADSLSLMAFEDIVRGARDWNNGQLPEQMTMHTELADERRPGFLHLRLNRHSDRQTVDFVLPDIPGEWTQTLITHSRYDRLEFLKSADVIWIVLDGRTLSDREKRHGVIARLGQLAGRLCTLLDNMIPHILVVVTHLDTTHLDDVVAGRILEELRRRGAIAEIIGVAPFSAKQDVVPAGQGIDTLMNKTASHVNSGYSFWPSSNPDYTARAYICHRRIP